MDLGLDEQQELLRRTAREFLEAECPVSLVRELEASPEGYSPDLWQKMADLGWLGLSVPTQYGGVGGSLIDQAALFEEIGRSLVPGPLLASSVYVVQAILTAATEKQKSDLLPSISSGETIVTAVLAGAGFDSETETSVRAVPNGSGYVLDGPALFVPYAHVADYFLCMVGAQVQTFATTLSTVLLIDTGTSGITTSDMDSVAGYKQHEVLFSHAAVPGDGVVGQVGGGAFCLARAEQWATVVQCAEIVGRCQKILEMVVEYSQNRIQFGRPIGSFQAVQHQCADLRVAVDGARLVTYQAAWKISEGIVCPGDIAVAKAYAGNLSRRAAATGHGIFAGIAFTTEHDMHMYTMRSKISEANLGDTDFQLEKLTQVMGL